jgi:hypothetical protein
MLQIYCIYEKKWREETPVVFRKKEGRRTYQGRYRDEASPSFRWDHDKGGRDLLFLRWDCDRGPCGTSSSGKTATTGPYDRTTSRRLGLPLPSVGLLPPAGPSGTGTTSSSGGTATIFDCDSETSSSTMCMCSMLGTSSSSYITCVANWSGETC